jgi:hypothetical protein
MRWQNPVSINQSEEGDFNYARVRTIYAVTEMSLAQFLIEKVLVVVTWYVTALGWVQLGVTVSSW